MHIVHITSHRHRHMKITKSLYTYIQTLYSLYRHKQVYTSKLPRLSVYVPHFSDEIEAPTWPFSTLHHINNKGNEEHKERLPGSGPSRGELTHRTLSSVSVFCAPVGCSWVQDTPSGRSVLHTVSWVKDNESPEKAGNFPKP